jgi:hypothetical protein
MVRGGCLSSSQVAGGDVGERLEASERSDEQCANLHEVPHFYILPLSKLQKSHTFRGFMNNRFILFISLFAVASPLQAYVVNRSIPDQFLLDSLVIGKSRVSARVRAGACFATHSTSASRDASQAYQYDGLLEMKGRYDLQTLVAAAESVNSSYVSPFQKETGGAVWDTSPRLLFGAQSTVSLYEATCEALVRVYKNLVCGVAVPVIKAEARQRYEFPVTENSQHFSPSDLEQVQRLRQATHRDLGFKQGDWVESGLGDATVFAASAQKWDRAWLLRTVEFAGMLEVTLPTSGSRNVEYPSAFPLGAGGGWSLGAGVRPRIELKEGIWISCPLLLAWQAPHTETQRLSVGLEAENFGGLIGQVKTSPGLTFSFLPKITFNHLIDNLHFSIGYYWARHYADTQEDMRSDQSAASYLTRTSMPDRTIRNEQVLKVMAQEQQLPPYLIRQIGHEASPEYCREQKVAYSTWRRAILRLGMDYELVDLFPKMAKPPLLSLGLDYCVSSLQAAATHRLSASLSWQF